MTESGKYLVDLVDREGEPTKCPLNWSGVWKFNSFSGINDSSVDKIEYDDKIEEEKKEFW